MEFTIWRKETEVNNLTARLFQTVIHTRRTTSQSDVKGEIGDDSSSMKRWHPKTRAGHIEMGGAKHTMECPLLSSIGTKAKALNQEWAWSFWVPNDLIIDGEEENNTTWGKKGRQEIEDSVSQWFYSKTNRSHGRVLNKIPEGMIPFII